ncbi:MAG: lipoprotein NlpI [Bacteroidetes bacterium]|nr:lipoprotein NlpI [Bacteroidota bacterium]
MSRSRNLELTFKKEDEILLEKALECYNSYDDFGADFFIRGAIKIDKKNPKAYVIRGLLEMETMFFEAAIENYNIAIQYSHNYPEMKASAYYYRGMAHFEMDDNYDAILDLIKAVDIYPNVPYGFYQCGRVRWLTGDEHGVISYFDKAIELDPMDPFAYYYRTLVNVNSGEDEDAIEDLNKFLELLHEGSYIINKEIGDSVGTSYFVEGVVKWQSGYYLESIEEFSKAIESDNNMIISYFARASSYEKLGNIEKAEEDRKKASNLVSKRYMQVE